MKTTTIFKTIIVLTFLKIPCASIAQVERPNFERLDTMLKEVREFNKIERQFAKACQDLTTSSSLNIATRSGQHVHKLNIKIIALEKFKSVDFPEAQTTYLKFLENYKNENLSHTDYFNQYKLIKKNIKNDSDSLRKALIDMRLSSYYPNAVRPNIFDFKKNLNTIHKCRRTIVNHILRNMKNTISILEFRKDRKSVFDELFILVQTLKIGEAIDSDNPLIIDSLIEIESKIQNIKGLRRYKRKMGFVAYNAQAI